MLWDTKRFWSNPEQDDDIWKNQNQWKILSWKLYETCGVHTLMVDGTLMTIHMFVEKKYPLTKETLQKMLNWKLEAEAESSMAFELLNELFALKKRGCDQSSSFTSALPQEFEMGESSRKTSVERHEEQIEEILNHLDELSLDRIEHIEDNIEGLGKVQRKVVLIQWQSHYTLMPPKRTSTSVALAMTRAAIRRLVADSVATALEAQTVNMANTDNTNGNTGPTEAHVARKCSYKEFMRLPTLHFQGYIKAIGPSAGLSELNQCFPVATVPKTAG
ncbi:hypothetical protein Tco_0212382 [Tanacetum coccineum]